MAKGLEFRQHRIKKETYVYPDLTKVNKTSYIAGAQFKELIASMTYREGGVDLESVFIDNMGREFYKSKPRFNGEGDLVLDGIFHKDKMIKLVDKFVQKLLTCPSCKGTRSTLMKPGDIVERHCHNCPAVTSVHTTDIGKIA
jgi:hypothetical protein